MLGVLQTTDTKDSSQIATLLAERSTRSAPVDVSGITADVRLRGDAALLAFTEQFDGVSLAPDQLRVDPQSIANAAVSHQAAAAMQGAIERIEAFHCREIANDWWTISKDGALLGQRFVPIDSVGVYVPGGRAPYASSLLMNVIPARIAGVRQIIAVTPPGPDGIIDPSILVAAQLCGIDEVYRIGGAQAIAALAYGTQTIPRVAKITGPGNAYVTAAKRLVYGDVGIDTIAGPSEIAILADESTNPQLIAADLIAQAEHDDDVLVVLITTAAAVVSKVRRAIEDQLSSLERQETICAALANSIAIITRDLAESVELVNLVAPEHLQIIISDPLAVVPDIQSAGVILCGPYVPAAICDYGIGPNHVLPTGGTGRFASALGVNDFLRRVSVVSASKEAFASVVPDAISLAKIEGLTGHAAALRLRMEIS